MALIIYLFISQSKRCWMYIISSCVRNPYSDFYWQILQPCKSVHHLGTFRLLWIPVRQTSGSVARTVRLLSRQAPAQGRVQAPLPLPQAVATTYSWAHTVRAHLSTRRHHSMLPMAPAPSLAQSSMTMSLLLVSLWTTTHSAQLSKRLYNSLGYSVWVSVLNDIFIKYIAYSLHPMDWWVWPNQYVDFISSLYPKLTKLPFALVTLATTNSHTCWGTGEERSH